MFPSVRRTFLFLARTPLVPPVPAGPAPIELSSFSTSTSTSSSSKPSSNAVNAISGSSSRPRAASRTFSSLSVKSSYNAYSQSGSGSGAGAMQMRGYASDKERQELYSDEAGGIGAGTDDVAHTDAAFDANTNPESATEGVQKESGKDFTNQSAPNPEYSSQPSEQGGKHAQDKPLKTSRYEAGKM